MIVGAFMNAYQNYTQQTFTLLPRPGNPGSLLQAYYNYGFIENTHTGAVTIVDVGHSSPVPGTVFGNHAGGAAWTALTAINDNGIAVGYYMDFTSIQHAFIFDSNTGTFTYIPDLGTNRFGGADSTIATGINNQGIVVGYYDDPTTQHVAGATVRADSTGAHSFVYDSNTNQFITTNFSAPGVGSIALTGINNSGMVSGQSGQNLITASLQPILTIDNGGTLHVTTTNYNTIHFAGGTGELVLADPTHFHGVITGFTGTAPDAAHSDVIDVAGYDFLDANFHSHYYSASGILTVQDSDSPSISLNFVNYSGNFVLAPDGHGGTLIFDPPSGPANIAAGELLEITSADDSAVTFTGGNGTLQLDDPSHFTGTIAGISGTGNVLDLDGFAAMATTAVTGSGSYHNDTNTTTLTVTDSSDNTTATLKLAGDLSDLSWTVSDDHHGGAKLVAAPVPASAPVMLASTSASDEMFGTSHADQFVFAANSNHDTIFGFTPGIDHIDLSALASIVNSSGINSFLASHVTSIDVGDTLITLDSTDSIVLRNIASSSLHAGNFILHA